MDPNTGVPTNQLSPESLEWMKSLDLQYMHLSEILNIPDHIENLDASNLDVKPHEKVIWSINEGIKRANQNAISNAQKIQKFRLLPHDFSIPTGELGKLLA